MNNLSRALAVALMAATIPATIVVAQQAEQPAAEKAESQEAESQESAERMQDGRIAMAKAALRLTPEQETLWTPVEEKIRARSEDRQKAREARAEKREERRAERGERGERKERDEDGKRERLALPDRLEKRSERMTKRAERLTERATKTKEFAEVLKPLYESFSEEQKAVASKVLVRLIADGRGPHGKRWAMDGDKRRHDRD